VSTPTGEDPGGGTSPSMHAATARAYFAQYHRVPLLLREKKKCPLGPDSPRRDKRCLDGAGGPPREVPEASMREGESECTSGRGIRWCRAM
jgi:hypothetical protein